VFFFFLRKRKMTIILPYLYLNDNNLKNPFIDLEWKYTFGSLAHICFLQLQCLE